MTKNKSSSKNSSDELLNEIDNIANQLCQTVDGFFDFTIKVESSYEEVDKLCMLINFMLNAAEQNIKVGHKKQRELEKAMIDLSDNNQQLAHMQSEAIKLMTELQSKNEILEKSQYELAASNAHAAELVAELEEKNQKLEEFQKKLVQAERMKTVSAMITTYNHEINNPLAIALGNLEICMQKDLEEDAKEFLSRTRTALNRILDILKSIDQIAKEENIEFDQYFEDTEMLKLKKS